MQHRWTCNCSIERSPNSASRAYRASQIWRWTARGAGGFDAMTNLPLTLRSALTDAVPFSTLTLEHEAHSADGTIKALFSTPTGGRSRRC